MEERTETAPQPGAARRRSWSAPRITELPPLTRLTLQSGIPGDCDPGDPSSCF
ncbi:MAG TPA: hypothetical protein VF142_10080 [Longimicrobium sp.]